jgi:predicted DNA-binding helix-hairpin-helix protein
MTACVYDCLYCVNRRSSNVRHARFTPERVVDLELGFHGGTTSKDWLMLEYGRFVADPRLVAAGVA